MSIRSLFLSQVEEKSIKGLSELGSSSDQKIEVGLAKSEPLDIESIKNRIKHEDSTVLAEEPFHAGPENDRIWADAFENYHREDGKMNTTSQIKFYKNGEDRNRKKIAKVIISNPTVELEDGTEYEDVYYVQISIGSGVYDEVMIIQDRSETKEHLPKFERNPE